MSRKVNFKQSLWTLTILLSVVYMTNCKKESTVEYVRPALQKLRNDWNVISVRIFFPNGSNYLLINDYQYFRSDNLKITKTTLIQQTSYDTAKYNLLLDDSTILFYGINNGVTSNVADTGYIRTLNDTLLVYYFKNSNGFINIIDSLKR
jgi:hypothetical protein